MADYLCILDILRAFIGLGFIGLEFRGLEHLRLRSFL
jgi:hypothetical protein